VIIAARPAMGKTAFAMMLAANEARTGIGVGVFSLEMARHQLVERMIAVDGLVEAARLRSGRLDQDDWDRVGRGMDSVAALPIFIGDAADLTLPLLVSRATKLKRDHPEIGVFVLDYLQLLDGRGEDRQTLISSCSRGLKLLAKTLDVCFVVLSQLNRKCEERSDKRPQMADLRECLAGDQLIYDTATGLRVPVRDVASVASVASLDHGAIRRCKPGATWSAGIKPIFRLRTATGREVRCSALHRFLTVDGWRTLADLSPGTRIATPRRLPEPTGALDALSADEARLLGYLVSDGSYCRHRSVSYTKADPVTIEDVRSIVLSRFGIVAKDKPCQGSAVDLQLTAPARGPGGNPLINWLDSLGIHGQRGEEKRVPEAIFRATNATVATFLGALWAGDGCVVPRKGGGWCLKFSSTSRGLLFDIQHLLLRLGVISVVGRPDRNTKSTMDIATVSIGDMDQIRAFADVITIPGIKGERLKLAAAHVGAKPPNHHIDRLPLAVTDRVQAAKEARGLSWSELGYRCQGKEMCRRDLARVAARLDDADMMRLATDDVLWDEVIAIEPDGEEETFDLEVPGPANFVVGDIVTHNSGAVEQDADVIMFIYRDQVYHPDTSDRGIAEIILAKQRAGPIGTVRLAFQDIYVRFASLAAQEVPQ
jgi:replicative DNA helicase